MKILNKLYIYNIINYKIKKIILAVLFLLFMLKIAQLKKLVKLVIIKILYIFDFKINFNITTIIIFILNLKKIFIIKITIKNDI